MPMDPLQLYKQGLISDAQYFQLTGQQAPGGAQTGGATPQPAGAVAGAAGQPGGQFQTGVKQPNYSSGIGGALGQTAAQVIGKGVQGLGKLFQNSQTSGGFASGSPSVGGNVNPAGSNDWINPDTGQALNPNANPPANPVGWNSWGSGSGWNY